MRQEQKDLNARHATTMPHRDLSAAQQAAFGRRRRER